MILLRAYINNKLTRAKEKCIMKKMNNKGFSLVELIIVIAIMAILASALAPQLMKYIEKSRVSTDSTTCATIESTVNAALANEEIYNYVATKVTSSDFTFIVTAGGAITGDDASALAIELKDTLSTLKAPKESGKTQYQVTVKTDAGKVGAVSCVTIGASGGGSASAAPTTPAGA